MIVIEFSTMVAMLLRRLAVPGVVTSLMFAALPACLASSRPAVAADTHPVVMRMKGGGFEVSGDLQGLDAGRYIVKSATQGTLALDAARFDCIGDACARAEALAAQTTAQIDRPRATAPEAVGVQGSTGIAGGLFPALVRGYAASIDATATQIVGTNTVEDHFRIADSRKSELASFKVIRNGTSAGIAALDQGVAQIALVERPFDGTQISAQPKAAPGRAPNLPAVQDHLLAFDATAIIVAPDNPLEALPLDKIAQVFAGDIADWGVLGQPSRPIKIYSVASDDDPADSLSGQILDPRHLKRAAALVLLPTPAHVAAAVAADPDGIGLTTLAAVGQARALGISGSCGLIVRPSPFSVKAGEYPLARSINLQTPAVPTQSAVRGLVRFAVSKDAAAAIAESPYFGPQVETQPFADQVGRIATGINGPAQDFDAKTMRDLVADLTGARRLSLTIRFADGGIALDAANRVQIERLSRFLRTPEGAARSIEILGFSTGGARFDVGQRVSMRRAAAVRAALLAVSGGAFAADKLVAKGYGALAPIACAAQSTTEYLNRRVEIWLKD